MAETKYSIIADPKGKSWDFALSVFNDLRLRSDAFELNEVNIKEFRDGEIKPKIKENVRGKVCFFIHDSSKDPSRWFLELCLVNQALKKSSASEIVDVFPYLKFARQDRKDESRVPISAEVIADAIELYADGVLTLDVHNPSIDGFFKIRFDNLYSFSTVVKYLKEKAKEDLSNFVVMSPDAGGAARAAAFAKAVGIKDVVIGYKVRKEEGEVDNLRISGNVEGKDIFVIDDMVDSGGTIVKASQVAKSLGAKKFYVYCTHGLFTKGVDSVLSHVDKFFIGDTIRHEKNEKIEVIPFTRLFADAIYRMSHGMSLSALFDENGK